MANKVKYENFLNKEEILILYNSGSSVIQIANQLNIKPQYIYRFMKYHNIPLRTISESLVLAYKNKVKKKNVKRRVNNYSKITKEMLVQLYYNDNKTISAVAKQLNVTPIGIFKLMKKYNMEKKKRLGLNNPHWKNGIMFNGKRKLIYQPNHSNINFLGKYVYEYRLVAEKKLGRVLNKNEVVHHIDNNSENNSSGNLLVLTQAKHINLHRQQGDLNGRK
jgi:predicted DNA-binding protein YlxM (UPF0122 family)